MVLQGNVYCVYLILVFTDYELFQSWGGGEEFQKIFLCII